MKFKKGISGNSAGRPKGQPNILTTELRERINDFLQSNWEEIEKEFKKLEPEKKLFFFEKLLKYIIPVKNSNELKFDFEKMTDSELDQIINRLIKKPDEKVN